MGYMRHHAILVSSSYADVDLARSRAVEFGNTCSQVVASPVNGYRSFLVAPDGSKEFWPDSDKGDVARSRFVEWLRSQQYEDDSGPFEWAEVIFGDEDGDPRVVQWTGSAVPDVT